jgi:4-amino-4-deoxy-L-arabinose transferase-like glycosyltransferase
MEKIINWVKKNKIEFAILIAILLLASFLRLYRIGDYMTYLGDEGRDVLVVRRLLVYFDLILIGPGTSIGNMYLGPLYYYLIAPSLWLARYSPVGPSVFVALMGIATVFLVWKIGREWFGKVTGVVAAFFYAISPTVIIFSRSSWNPNVMPFFALVSIYSVWKVWREGKYKWLIVLGISYAFCLQSHYLALLLLPTLGIFLFIKYLKLKKEKLLRPFIKSSLIGLAIFIFLMSPLVIFDARHGWHNFAAIGKFFAVRQETVSIKPWKAVPKVFPILEKINSRLIGGRDVKSGVYLTIVIIVFAIWLAINRKTEERKSRDAYILVFTWLAFALIGLGLYKQEIYDHYYGFFFPVPFFLLGALVQDTYKVAKKAGRMLIVLGVLYLVFINFKQNPLRSPPNMQLKRAMDVSKKVIEISGGEKFNFALIAESNYDSSYRYFLDLWNSKVVTIDAQNTRDTITSQLFVVCETPKEKCDPTHNAKAEVANFGWSKIESEQTVFGTNLYKLVHTK